MYGLADEDEEAAKIYRAMRMTTTRMTTNKTRIMI